MSIVRAADLAVELAGRVGPGAHSAESALAVISREATELLAGTSSLSRVQGQAASTLYREGHLVSSNSLSLHAFSSWPKKTGNPASQLFGEANYLRNSNYFHNNDQLAKHLGDFTHEIPTPSGQMLRITSSRLGTQSVGYFKASADSQHFLAGTKAASGNPISMNVVSTGRFRDIAFQDSTVHYKYGQGSLAPGWTDTSNLSPIHSTSRRNFWPSAAILGEAIQPKQLISSADRAGFGARVRQLVGAEVHLPMGKSGQLIGVDPHSLEAIVWKPDVQLKASLSASGEMKQLYHAGQTPNRLDAILRDAKGAIYHKEAPNSVVRVDGYSVAQPSEVYLPKMNENLSRILSLKEHSGMRGQGVYEAARDGSSLELSRSILDAVTKKIFVI